VLQWQLDGQAHLLLLDGKVQLLNLDGDLHKLNLDGDPHMLNLDGDPHMLNRDHPLIHVQGSSVFSLLIYMQVHQMSRQ
jgi:hypothetical protein